MSIQGTGTDDNALASNIIGLNKNGGTGVGNGRGVTVGAGSAGTAVGWAVESAGGEAPTGAQDGLARIARLGIGVADEPIGQANQIAGNVGVGVRVQSEGGWTQVAGNTIRDNGSAGVVIEGRPDCWIGGNAITGNTGAGIVVSGAVAKPVTISGNKIWANTGKGISLEGGANGGIAPPTILQASASGASGTACSLCEVQIFSDDGDEGERPETTIQADLDGSWLVLNPLTGPNITAVNTSLEDGTSEFAVPWSIEPTATVTEAATPTETATPTSSATASPSPSATSTPTPASSWTPTASATLSPQPSVTSTTVPTVATGTATRPASATPTGTGSASVTATRTATPTPAATQPPKYLVYVPLLIKGEMP